MNECIVFDLVTWFVVYPLLLVLALLIARAVNAKRKLH